MTSPGILIFINTALRTSNFTNSFPFVKTYNMVLVQECDVALGRPYSSEYLRKVGDIECIKRPTNAFGFMDVILLYSGHQHVLATHVTIFRVLRRKIHI